MLFSDRLEIEGVLKSLAPLHIGTGEDRPGDDEMPERHRDGRRPRVATVVRDHERRPCLPGSTVKGILRALAGEDAVTRSLFGEINSDGGGEMGRLHCFTALMTGPPPATDNLPYAEPEAGVFVASRTRIDRATGTADDTLLYAQEMVAPGARFTLRLRVLAPGKLDDELARLAAVLKALQQPEGQPFGKGQAAGQGRLRLQPDSLRVTRHRLDAGGSMTETPFELPAAKEAATDTKARPVHLRLHCPGPFLVIDAARSSARVRGEGRNEAPQVAALQGADGQPMLHGTGLMGVLRARTAWLAALNTGAAGQDNRDRLLKEEGPHPADSRADDVVRSAGDLTPVERLFGVTGWRGLVRLARLEQVGRAQPIDLTSVAIDRFSGGPIDNALFRTHAFLGTAFEVTLTLERRGEFPNAVDEALFERLIDSLAKEDLVLGHGGNKGFGWFEVTRHDG